MKKGIRTDLSVLRIIATISIVYLHTCTTLTDNLNLFSMTDVQYWFYGSSKSVVSAMLPVFFMITGIFMLSKDRVITPRLCVCKYMKRMILALFVYGIPFSVLMQVANSKTLRLEQMFAGGG